MNEKNSERRGSQRLLVVDSFALFVTLPKRPFLKLKIYDVSATGLQCDVVVEGEPDGSFSVAPNEELDVHLYLNQFLFLPLRVRVARIDQSGPTRRIGAEIIAKGTKSYESYTAFVKMLETLPGAAQFKD